MVYLKGAMVLMITVLSGVMGLAWGLDCNGRLISLGHMPWEVQAICGDPAQIEDSFEVILKPVRDRAGQVVDHIPVAVPKSVWIYNFGSARLIYLLTFREGKLVNIETGGYGH